MKNQPPSSIPVLYITLSPPNRVSKSELYRTTNDFLWKLSHFTDTHLHPFLRKGRHTGNKHEHLAVGVMPDELERFWKRYSRFTPSQAWKHEVVSNGDTTNLEVRVYNPEKGVGLSEYIFAHKHLTPERYNLKVLCPRHYNRCDEEYCRHDRAHPHPQPASNRRKGDNK